MLRNKKIFVVLLSVVVLLFSFMHSSYASTNSCPQDVIDFATSNNRNSNVVVLRDKESGYYYIPVIFKGYSYGDNANFVYRKYKDVYGLTIPGWQVCTVYKYDGNDFIAIPEDEMSYWGSNSFFQFSYNGRNIEVAYSTLDILNEDGSVFFRQPEVEKMVLAPVLEVVEMDKVLIQIIQILPMILVVVVSLVGLRKGWQVLSKLLHRA